MRAAASIIILLVAGGSAQRESPPEQRIIRAAMTAGTCSGTGDISLMLGFSESEIEYTRRCWESQQSQIVAPALAANNCKAVLKLPGVYPVGSDDEKRFVYQCWMTEGIRDLDSCIGMLTVGNKSSIPFIVRVLKRNRPVRLANSDQLAVIDTAGACMEAFGAINQLSHAEVVQAAKHWGGTWPAWAKSSAVPANSR